MTMTLTAQFDTRRDAEMTVERLVQEHGLDRSAIVIATTGADNSAGDAVAGADGGAPGSAGNAALNGGIIVSVEVDDAARAAAVMAAFAEFDAEQVTGK